MSRLISFSGIICFVLVCLLGGVVGVVDDVVFSEVGTGVLCSELAAAVVEPPDVSGVTSNQSGKGVALFDAPVVSLDFD